MQLQWQSPTGRTKTLLLSWQTVSETPWNLCLTDLPTSFPLYNSDLFPWPFEDLHVALHSCKPRTIILCWSHKPIFAREISDTLFVSCQQRERGSTCLGDPWKTQATYSLDTSEWTLIDTSQDDEVGRSRSQKIKKKLQEIKFLGRLVFHKDTPYLWDVLHLAWDCSYCIKLPKLSKLNAYRKQIKARKSTWQSSPRLHLQHVNLSLLMRNKWYSGNGAKNPSLKLNISMYSQSLVTEGLTAPTSLNHLSTRPVHIPPHVISFSDKSLWRVWLDASGSFHTHTPFARGQFTDWDVASVSGVRMQPFPDGQMHLVQDPTPPSSLGIGPALTPNLLLLGWGVGGEMQSTTPRLQCRTAGTLPGRVSTDWAWFKNCATDFQ